jgi:rare lipoprotein A
MTGSRFTLACAALAFGLAGLSGAVEAKPLQRGAASWYGPGFHGRKTASGERFNTHALTAAHRTLPFGTRVRVTNERTGRSVVVRINDRGPYAHGRVIDLSKASAQAVGLSGVAPVSLARM